MGRPCNRCGEKPGHALVRWAGVLVVGLLFEAEGLGGKRHHHTFSHATRSVFKTHTPRGRAAFSVAWLGLALWYHRHIVTSHHNYNTKR